MPDFVVTRERDAYFVIRGFRYQIDLTILRWLDLCPGQVLELERGEDIDIIAGACARDPQEEFERELEQVKHSNDSLTLRSAGARAALANAAAHLRTNPDLRLAFRFCTNARIGLERPSPFGDRSPAIAVWEAIRNGEVEIGDAQLRLPGIRSLLRSTGKPEGVDADTWSQLQAVVDGPDEVLLDVIGRFEWSAGQPAPEALADKVRAELLGRAETSPSISVDDLRGRLFLYVLTLLSRPGLKRLTCEELEEQLLAPPLSAADAVQLERLATRVFRFEERLDSAERLLQQHGVAIAGLGRAVFSNTDQTDRPGTVALAPAQPDLATPPKVTHLCRRGSAVEALMGQFHSAGWVSLRGSVGSGKTQLAILATEAHNGPASWLRLRDMGSLQAFLAVNAAVPEIGERMRLGGKHTSIVSQTGASAGLALVVLDDLPRLAPETALSDLMVELTLRCRNARLLLLSATHYPIPPRVTERLPPGSLVDIAVPSLTDDEAGELLAAHGAPPPVLASKATFLNVLAQGNPTLLAAVCRFLASAEWRIDSRRVQAIIQHQHTSDVMQELLPRLLATVGDGISRELLYRVCLCVGAFGEEEVTAAANVSPAVSRPQERLTRLSGLWIEQQGRGSMTVCPLVKPLGNTELTAETRAATHVALGDLVFGKKPVSVLDVSKAVGHFQLARAHARAAICLSTALWSSNSLPDGQANFLLGLFPLGTPLPDSVPADIHIHLRLAQVRVANRLGKNISDLLADADRILESGSQVSNVATFMLALVVGPILAERDFSRAVDYVSRGLQVWPHLEIPDDAEPLFPPEASPGHIVWLLAPHIDSPKHMKDWLGLFKHIRSADLAAMLECDIADDMAIAVVDKMWLREADKPKAKPKWPAIVAAYEMVIQLADELGLQLIWMLMVL